jgi:hypothetical protein
LFFAEESKRVELAEHDLTGVTDIVTFAETLRTSIDTDITFILSQDEHEVARMQANQLLSLAAPLDGIYKVFADLYGSAKFSPLLGRDPQMITGKLQLTGDYVSRAFRCGSDRRIMVTIDAITPGTSSIDVYVLTAEETWTLAELDEADPIGDQWHRQFYYVPCNLAETKIKIVLAGDAAARPRVKNIRGVVLSV